VSLAGKGETVARFSYRPVETGTLAVQAATSGTVSITGPGVSQSVSISPGQTLRQNYPAGTYTVRIRYGDGKEESRTVSLGGKGETAAGFTYRPAAMPAGFVRVEGGTFQMGSTSGDSDEKPVHTVTVSGFYMSKYEVTQKEWREVMGTSVSQQRDMRDKSWSLYGVGDTYPMYYVNWYEAVEYCNKRSVREGLTPAYRGSGDSIVCDFRANGYRLPTEAEWEYAAKGGNQGGLTYEYSGSNSVDAVGWYSGNSGGSTHAAGTKQPNSLGLYDMSGNVWEWCWDWYGSYSGGSQTDPRGPASGSNRVLRGGSWYDYAWYLRSANRNYYGPSLRYNFNGFRLVRALLP
jgi:formylglycine-generating enzyme required for sulfatase activity